MNISKQDIFQIEILYTQLFKNKCDKFYIIKI